MNISKRLKGIRVSKGLSLKEVQLYTSISSQHKLEQEKYKSFKCEHLIRLSEYYQISPLYLLGVEEDFLKIEPKWVVLIQKLKEHDLKHHETLLFEKYKGISLRKSILYFK
ncbi:helix-turn-helix domain-containing protein [Metabacillus halosaccharovorans]|uniref:HTH cro/C1-type domain-containing protein n=1 Tax=Metabacillus halosaccharovorans TaxID=930124 RepID=A0ABT3DDI7_9BACI|nr:hypothetical protein [Metabacillus halosaccharovorans]MCV9885118.1 hypothetical protein [Metabacillus halosaccharovorans]